MANHPNRSRRQPSPAAAPSPEAIRAARAAAGLSQSQAAAVIYSTLRSWQAWEAGERTMHPQFFEAFVQKTTSRQA